MDQQDHEKKKLKSDQRVDYASLLQGLYGSIERTIEGPISFEKTDGKELRTVRPISVLPTTSKPQTDRQAAYKIPNSLPVIQEPSQKSSHPTRFRNYVATSSNEYQVPEDKVENSPEYEFSTKKTYLDNAPSAIDKLQPISATNEANYIVVSMCNMASLQHNLSKFSDTCATTLLWSGSARNNTPLRLFNGHLNDPFYFGFTLDPTATRILFGAKKDFMSSRQKPMETNKLGARIDPWWKDGERWAIETSKYGYAFSLMSELTGNKEPMQGQIYFEVNPNNKKQLKYIVLDPNGNKQEDYIELNKEITGELTTQDLYWLRKDILQRLLEKGHIHAEYKKHEKKGCTTMGGGMRYCSNYYTNYAQWVYKNYDIIAERINQKGILDGGTFHEKASWDIFATNMRLKYLRKVNNPYYKSDEIITPLYNEALVAPKGEQNPINGIIIPYENIEKISVQDLAKLINILQINPKLKLFIYDKSLKEHIIREIKGEAAISLLNNRLKLTTEQIASLPPFSGQTLDPTSSSLPTNGGPSRFRRY